MPAFGKQRQGQPRLYETLSKQTTKSPEGQWQIVVPWSIGFWDFICSEVHLIGSTIEEMDNAFPLFLPDTLQNIIFKIGNGSWAVVAHTFNLGGQS